MISKCHIVLILLLAGCLMASITYAEDCEPGIGCEDVEVIGDKEKPGNKGDPTNPAELLKKLKDNDHNEPDKDPGDPNESESEDCEKARAALELIQEKISQLTEKINKWISDSIDEGKNAGHMYSIVSEEDGCNFFSYDDEVEENNNWPCKASRIYRHSKFDALNRELLAAMQDVIKECGLADPLSGELE